MAVIQPTTLQDIVLAEFEGKAFVFNTRESRPDIVKEIIFDEGGANEESYGFQAIKDFPIAGVLTNAVVSLDTWQPFFEISGDFQISPSEVVTLRNQFILNPTTYSENWVAYVPDFLASKFGFNQNSSAPSTQTEDIEIVVVNPDTYGGGTISLTIEDITDSDGVTETAADRGFSISAGSSISVTGSAFGRVDHTFTLQFDRTATEILLGGYNIVLKADDGTDEQYFNIPVLVEDINVS